MIHRRHVLAGLGTGALGACVSGPLRLRRTPEDRIDDLVSRDGRPLAGAGLVVRRSGETIFAHGAGDAAGLEAGTSDRRPFTPDTKMRVASVSKLAVTLTALSLHDEGLLDLDADVQRWWPGLRNPAFPDTGITVAHLLSHRSSLVDPEVYWLAVPGKIETLFTDEAFGASGPPGRWFEYCNLNYGIAATILERAAKTRLDRLVRERTLEPIGIGGAGFNWAGVCPLTGGPVPHSIARSMVTGWYRPMGRMCWRALILSVFATTALICATM